MKVNEPPVVVEQDFDVPIGLLWQANTDINEMRQWYFEIIPDFKPEVGFETQFTIENEGRNFLHTWKVTEANAPRKIVYDWSFEGYEGKLYTVFELSELNEKTRLTLNCIVREDFPDGIPEFERESCLGGWNYFIKESLKSYINKNY